VHCSSAVLPSSCASSTNYSIYHGNNAPPSTFSIVLAIIIITTPLLSPSLPHSRSTPLTQHRTWSPNVDITPLASRQPPDHNRHSLRLPLSPLAPLSPSLLFPATEDPRDTSATLAAPLPYSLFLLLRPPSSCAS
jgi:hypothetical protein